MDIITVDLGPTYTVEIRAPNAALESRDPNYQQLYCWRTSDEVDEWLGQNVKGGIHVSDLTGKAQGILGSSYTIYLGLNFIFTDPKEAMLFKLAWA